MFDKRLFTNGDSFINGTEEIKTNRFFRESRILAKILEKTNDRYDYRRNIFYNGDKFSFFRNSRRVNRVERGKRADEFNFIFEYEGKNIYIPNGNERFLK